MIRRQEGKVSKLNFSIPAALLLLMATSAHAQNGCVDSPENPTVVFGLIAAAASILLLRLRSRSGFRNK